MKSRNSHVLLVALLLLTGCATQQVGRHGGSPEPNVGTPGSATTASPTTTDSPETTDAPETSQPGSASPEAAAEAKCPLCVDPKSPKIMAAYAAAVEATKYPAQDEISRDLVPLLKSTEGLVWDDQGRILMSTWTQAKYYSDPETYRRGESFTLYGDMWLTAVPSVRDFCQKLGLDGAMLTLRLEQLMGLPPADGKDAFLEIWVNPTDIFRPCPDPEISDHECQVEIPVIDRTDEKPWDCTVRRQVSGRYVTVHPGHLRWMCDNWESSYASEDPLQNYPWTALGYTYDWGNPEDPRGQSEYVVPGDSKVVFESLTPTGLYCMGPSGE